MIIELSKEARSISGVSRGAFCRRLWKVCAGRPSFGARRTVEAVRPSFLALAQH